MKKIQALVMFFCVVVSGMAQTTIDFNPVYRPGKVYNEKIIQISKNEIKYKGPKAKLDILTDKGVKNPTTQSTTSTIESKVITGNTGAGGRFPLQIKFGKITSDAGVEDMLKDAIIYGQCETGKMPELDSIVAGAGMDDNTKATMLNSMKTMLTQLNFSERVLKPGESFSTESPISIPFAGSSLDMTIKTTYKLVTITDGIAVFNIVQTYTMKVNIADGKLKGSGSGTGQLQYDIASGFYTKYQLDTEMKLNAGVEDIQIEVTSASGFVQTTTVTNNQ